MALALCLVGTDVKSSMELGSGHVDITFIDWVSAKRNWDIKVYLKTIIYSVTYMEGRSHCVVRATWFT